MKKRFICLAMIFLITFSSTIVFADNGPAYPWSNAVTISNPSTFTDQGLDARQIHPGTFGANYGRMTKLANGDWIQATTIYNNNGYTYDANGGTRLQINRSTDNGASWSQLAIVSDPGRDLDNGQLLRLGNGDLLMSCRSVRWQESYRILVYKSTNNGQSWTFLSTVDSNEGTPGSLGNPDKGVYEPHLFLLGNGNIGIVYANEKHVTENPSYSQIISEKVSSNNGQTWGNEIWAVWSPSNMSARPGMPVCTKMNNGKYILLFEDSSDSYFSHYKISDDGVTWSSGLGTFVPGQTSGGPYVLSLRDGRIVVTSNSSAVTFSNDYGSTWYVNATNPWGAAFPDYSWASLYQMSLNQIGAMVSEVRASGGTSEKFKTAPIYSSFTDDFTDGNDNGWTRYGGTWSVSGGSYAVNSVNCDKSIVTPMVSLINYSLEADVKVVNNGQASLLFDVTSSVSGVDSFNGYGVGIDTGGSVWLGKWNNSWSQLASASMTITPNTSYHLKVEKVNGRIKVYVNGALMIDVTNTSYNYGTIGVRGGFNNSASFDNISVSGFEYKNDFSGTGDSEWTRYGGTWSITGGAYRVVSGSGDKSLVTSPKVTNSEYTIESDVKIVTAGQGSIIFEASNPGTGADSMYGYGAGIDTNGTVWLGKFSNNYTQLSSVSATITAGTLYRLKITKSGSSIKVYFDGVLKIDTSDSSYNNGTIGVRGGFSNTVDFDNILVY